MCPFNRNVRVTDFRRLLRVALDPVGQTQSDPLWVVLDQGAQILQLKNRFVSTKSYLQFGSPFCMNFTIYSLVNGGIRLHQIPVIPKSEMWGVPFDHIIPESEWPEFNSADSGLKAEFL